MLRAEAGTGCGDRRSRWSAPPPTTLTPWPRHFLLCGTPPARCAYSRHPFVMPPETQARPTPGATSFDAFCTHPICGTVHHQQVAGGRTLRAASSVQSLPFRRTRPSSEHGCCTNVISDEDGKLSWTGSSSLCARRWRNCANWSPSCIKRQTSWRIRGLGARKRRSCCKR